MESTSTVNEVRVPVASSSDVVVARDRARALSARAGLSGTDSALMATAVSELARNIVAYAGRGEMVLRLIEDEAEQGVEVIAVDAGPGIVDLELALQNGYSTSRGGRSALHDAPATGREQGFGDHMASRPRRATRSISTKSCSWTAPETSP
jgi:serine/threonine-protein kinase RsbT